MRNIKYINVKRKIEFLLENETLNKFLVFLILANLSVFILDTDIRIHNNYKNVIYYFDIFSIVFFSIEYSLRVFILDNIKDIFKPLMIIDLLAILPFYLSFIKINTVFLRVLRMFRLLRIFKIGRYTKAFENIKNSFLSRKDELVITFLIFFSGVIISSTLMYYAEGQVNSHAFGSIPRSFWWSIITFTTVGYGDVYPITTIGKIIGGLTAILGVGLHGLLVGVIGVAFMDVLGNKKTENKVKEYNKNEVL